ncbi:MAG: hypothetical protein ACE5G1_13960, partial [bacterium]
YQAFGASESFLKTRKSPLCVGWEWWKSNRLAAGRRGKVLFLEFGKYDIQLSYALFYARKVSPAFLYCILKSTPQALENFAKSEILPRRSIAIEHSLCIPDEIVFFPTFRALHG